MPEESVPPFRAVLRPEWIDYNGHLRDAYYGVLASLAIDAFMDHVGLDRAYRERTGCTLFTVEQHVHFLREVKLGDDLEVGTSVLDADHRRIHAGCRFTCGGSSEAAATTDLMLLHVERGTRPAVVPFPPDVGARIAKLKLTPTAREAWGPASRRITLARRGAP